MVSVNKSLQIDSCSVSEEQSSGPARKLSSEDFVALVIRHEGRVRSFILTLLLPSNDVDDVFQNSCVVALRKIDTFSYTGSKPDECFVRWLCTIARYEVLQLLRSRRTSKIMFDSALVEKLADMQLREMELLRDRSELLQACIERLTERERRLLCLRYGEDRAVADVAEDVGLSANGVYKALDRIRGRLLECIRRKLGNEG